MRFDRANGVIGALAGVALVLSAGCSGVAIPVAGEEPSPPAWLEARAAESAGSVQQLEGAVRGIYPGRRALEIQSSVGDLVFVELPEDAPQSMLDEYDGLLPDDRVRLEVRVADDRVELVRFGRGAPDRPVAP